MKNFYIYADKVTMDPILADIASKLEVIIIMIFFKVLDINFVTLWFDLKKDSIMFNV